MTTRKTFLLTILDGWGYREEIQANAIACAHTPTWDDLWQHSPHTLISGSGEDVGLPGDQMGNSEVGHMSLGAGRVVYQDFTRINRAIESGDFFTNPVLNQTLEDVRARNASLHILGLASAGGVHSHENHLLGLIDLAVQKGLKKVYLHAFLDGRDSGPKSGLPSLQKLDKALRDAGAGCIASICGRFYAMDRDQRWERVEAAYRLLTEGVAAYTAQTAEAGLSASYMREETDEFVKPTRIAEAVVQDGDSIIFMNFRADRARQLSRAFVDPGFMGFARRAWPKVAHFVSLTEYAKDIPTEIAFPPQSLRQTIGEYLAGQGKTQLRIAETEKYAHVTFFLNGGVEAQFPGEDRILVNSPRDVVTYDEKPEMSAFEVTEKLIEAIRGGQYDAIFCNFANGDMVGHTGNFEAAKQAVEVLDTCLGRIIAALKSVGGECLITADHGNVEMMTNPVSGETHTAHTSELVPLVYVGDRSMRFVEKRGILADVAPTLLTLMGLPVPEAMTGRNLLRPNEI